MQKRIKVLFLINTLGGGGAERVLVNLVNNMDKSMFDITVKTMFKGGVNRERLSKDIRYENKNAPLFKGIAQAFCFIPSKILYRYFIGKEKYDILIAYMHGGPTKVISGCRDKNVGKISWLHTGNPESSSFFKFWFRKKAAFSAYEGCNAIVGVSQSIVDAFSSYTGIKNNLHVVYNTNETEKIKQRSKEKLDIPFKKTKPIVCSVGSLTGPKGYDRLITSASKLHDEKIDFDLIIIGKGANEDKLKRQIKSLNAENYIHLIGFKENPFPIMKASDIFISSSRQEGLATVVSEALILGIPVISTDVSGAKELLGNKNEYGLVVENSEQGIYDGLKAMLTDSSLLTHYKARAIERAPFFSTEETVKQAEKLISSIYTDK